MAVYTFLLAIVHVPGVTGATTLASWGFLSLTLPWLLLGKLEMTLGHWLGVLFLSYATLSLQWSPRELDGIESLWHWAMLGGAFCLGHRLKTLRGAFLGLGLGLAVSVVVGAFQIAGFEPVLSNATYPAVSGLLYNSNVFSETAAIVMVGLIVYRLWWLAGLVAVGVLMGEGRGALLALTMVSICCFIPAKYRFIVLLGAAAAMGAVLSAKYSTMSGSMRMEVLTAAFADGNPVFGHGIGSFGIETWRAWFDHLHNDFLEAIYEFGIGAWLLFALLASAVCRTGPARPVLFCFAVIACFSFPVALPVTGFVAALVTGHLHRYRRMVWHRDAFRRSHIHESVEGWGYWSDREGRGDVSLQSPAAQRAA